MTELPNGEEIAVVTGDVTMDWNLARTRPLPDAGGGSAADPSVRACWQRGGAALLADLVEAVAASLREAGRGNWVLRQMAAPLEAVSPVDVRFCHSYSMWSLMPYSTRAVREPKSWRVEEFLGYARSAEEDPSESAGWRKVVNDSPCADLVVLDDAGHGFRSRPDLWPTAVVQTGCRPWIVVKMSEPVAQGDLWDHLHKHHADRLVVFMTVNNLRRTEVQISRELSWERTAQDLFWELVHNPRVNTLSRCAHVVVSFGAAGALVLSRLNHGVEGAETRPLDRRCQLHFDPAAIEGTWEQEYPGRMVGYGVCLTAALARQIMLDRDEPDVTQGVQAGLMALRRLHMDGYGERGAAAERAPVVFPIRRVVAELAGDKSDYAVVDVQDPVRFLGGVGVAGERAPEGAWWTILEDRYRDSLDRVAERIVLEGAEVALDDVPRGVFGHLLTVDRREIESFRSIRTLVGEYCCQGQQKRPISIAVFGAPGSGKSFGITQVASSLLPGQVDVLEFNLSQFASLDDLLAAFHRIRDAGLRGRIPLVFWDEFDSPFQGRSLGWLRYFLAPMQDGHFQEGQVIHPIGRAVFVFAGGTCERMEEFGQRLAPDEFRAAKGPDFVSRLKGYADILGPNRRTNGSQLDPSADPYHIIRRAILLRSILKRNTPNLFEKAGGHELLSMDTGVLRAYLRTREYRHGVRSMEAIVAMSLLAGKARYERSSLPAEAQLDLHVNGQDFLALVQLIDLEGVLLDQLARAAHGVFCEELRSQGYTFGPRTDESLRTHSSLQPFDRLPEEEREQNRQTVRDIPGKLAATGHVMMPARSNQPPFGFPGAELERLAQLEHERWMKAKLAEGWQHALLIDKARRMHSALVPWEVLPEYEREKDRVLVRRIPEVLARVGYTIVKVE